MPKNYIKIACKCVDVQRADGRPLMSVNLHMVVHAKDGEMHPDFDFFRFTDESGQFFQLTAVKVQVMLRVCGWMCEACPS